MNKRKLIPVLIIIALVIGAVMIIKAGPDEKETIMDYHVPSAPEVSEISDPDEVVAAPKEESSLPLDIESLPTISDIKELSEDEVHHTPEVVLESARALSNMIEAADKNPELREKTTQFLVQCSETENLVNSIRAICWKQTMKAVDKWQMFVPMSEVKVPANIMELSEKLPD